MNRRVFGLVLVGVLLLSMVAACGPTPEPQVVERVETQVIRETVIVEGTPQVVEKVVTREVVKEVEKVVTPTPQVKDTLVFAQGGNPINLDPSLQESIADYNTYAQIYDSLLWRDEKGQFQLKLAESFERLDDLTWEVKLRQGVKFHNGEDLTADAVKLAFDRILDPELGSQLIDWNSYWDKIEIVDDYTLRLTTLEPTPTSMVAHTLSRLWPVPPKLLAEQGADYLITNPVGTGPYKFVEWKKDEYVKMERFEGYWGPAPAYKYIVIRIIPDGVTRAAALLAGEVDIVYGLWLTHVPLVEASPIAKVASVPGGRIAMIQFALLEGEPTSVEPLRDKRVRRALAQAIDVENNILPLMEGYARPTGTMVCSACFGFDPAYADPIPYDPEKAKALLAEAGYPDGFKMTLATASGSRPMDKETAEAVAGEWAKIGVDCTVQPMENTAYLVGWKAHTFSDVDSFNLNLLSQNWDADGMLARRFLEGEIMTYWFTDETNELLVKAIATTDDAERQRLYSRMQEIIRDEVPVIPLYERHVIMGVSNEVEYTVRPDDWSFLQYAKPAQ